jgi:phosphoglycolate phosphatase
MRDTTIVFDLDGTLIDTAPDLIRCTNHALGRAGLAPVPPELVRPVISLGARRMILRGLELHGHAPSAAEIDHLFEDFIAHYVETIAEQSRPFPHLIETLDALTEQGATLAVCTNKLEGMSRKLLAELGLARRFAVIAGRDTFPVHKPDPGHLLGTIAAAGGVAGRAVMVGDSDVDIATAKAARVPVVAVTFGYSEHPVDALGPDALITHYRELLPALTRLAVAVG